MKVINFKDIVTFSYGTIPDKKLILTDGAYPIFGGYIYSGFYPYTNIDTDELVVVARGVGETGDVKLTILLFVIIQ